MSTSASKKNLGKLSLGLTLVLGSLLAQQASAHGYVESPKSRSLMCYQGANTGCVAPWEPQGVEYSNGDPYGNLQPGLEAFPIGGPKDGEIAAGGLNGKYGNLNPQTGDRWTKTDVHTGQNTFKWHYTAAHRTSYWQFFITKKDWNPNMPLSRSSFESTPIGQDVHNGSNADSKLGGMKSQHSLNIPSDRSGYHVILATWKTADTSASFYQVVDVNVKNDAVVPSVWKDVGSITPSQADLPVDTIVKARVMVDGYEDASKETVLTIGSTQEGKSNQWPHQLATQINAANVGYKAGQLTANDQVKPAYGLNTAYVQKNSNVSNVWVDIQQPLPVYSVEVSGINSTYTTNNGKVTLRFNVKTTGDASHVTNVVYNAQDKEVARSEGRDVEDGSEQFTVTVDPAVAGRYDLVTIGKPASGAVKQKTSAFTILADDIVDPTPPEPTPPEPTPPEPTPPEPTPPAPIPGEECKPLWKTMTAYQDGDQVQHNGRIYLAKWYTTREPGDPAYTDTTGQGWGYEWADRGACSK